MSLSALAAEHLSNPRNVGPLEGSTHEGISWAPWLLPGDGPYIKLWLTLDGDRIAAAAYQANGCPSSIACGSIVAQVLRGRTLDEALRLEPHDINLLLGGLPEGKEYCAEMAVKALRSALLGEESNAQ
jgi:NifU-like protein involved in Fe-S cluster formation